MRRCSTCRIAVGKACRDHRSDEPRHRLGTETAHLETGAVGQFDRAIAVLRRGARQRPGSGGRHHRALAA